ncbi:MAG: ABC transporter permease [Eubacteriales bacterium]|nr:ABC transporter permease [Eubacteriales bacterium]
MADILSGTLRTATPILLAALGGLLFEKAGVFSIAHEGMMLFGAFFGVWGMHLTHSVPMAILFALAIGAIVGLIYVWLIEKMNANATIASIGVNAFAVGITTYMMKSIFGDAGSVGTAGIIGLPKIDIPFIGNIPFIGKVINGHTILVYVSIVLVVILSYFLFHTHTGINLRAVGERPQAAASAGIPVLRYRIIACIVGGALCGLAGVHLSLGHVTLFAENMTAGRGFFAYTAVVFGQANPVGVMIASLVFGLAETVTYRAQQIGFPGPLVLTVPYIITILALIIRSCGIFDKFNRYRWRRKAQRLQNKKLKGA